MDIDLQQKTRDEINTVWDIDKFNQPRLPAVLGELRDKEALQKPASLDTAKKAEMTSNVKAVATEKEKAFFFESGLYIEDMPIKFPDTEFRVPQQIWNNFADVLNQLIGYEKDINPNLDEFYVYLTIQQTQVNKDEPQRKRGIHIDGFQKASILPQVIQHQIAVTNCIPTIFYSKAMDADKLKRSKHEFFAELVAQCEDAETFIPEPYQVHLLNAYCPHQTGIATEDGFRTFIRFSISKLPFMGDDNTRNPLFDYDWNPEAKKAFYSSISR